MNILFLFLWTLVLRGGSSAPETAERKCRVAKELNNLCGEHTFQSISPILRYVDQLQEERREINDLRKKVNQQDLKLVEGKFKDDLIVALNNTVISKDKHIQDLQATVAELRDTNRILKQNVESVNTAIDKFELKLSKIDSNDSNLSSCEEQLLINNRTIAQNTAQLKSKDADLKTCESSLNEYKLQSEIQNKTIAENNSSVSQLKAELNLYNQTQRESQSKLKENKNDIKKLNEINEQKDLEVSKLKEQNISKVAALKTCESSLSEYKVQSSSAMSQLRAEVDSRDRLLKESQTKLKDNQDELVKQKHIIQQKDQEVSKLKEQIKKNKEIPTICNANFNGIRNVILPNYNPFTALCNSDIAGSGWTVIQQRINGGEDFNRNWGAYKNGFGNFAGDFFLGLERIHRLTKDTPHELYIYMVAFERGNVERYLKRNTFYARYDNFSIAGEDDKYRLLSLGKYSGSADRDWMRKSEHAQFSTLDRDNDAWNGKCAVDYHAGWWFNSCSNCNLNGKYYQQEVDKEDSNWWMNWYSLKTIKMMIRPRGN